MSPTMRRRVMDDLEERSGHMEALPGPALERRELIIAANALTSGMMIGARRLTSVYICPSDGPQGEPPLRSLPCGNEMVLYPWLFTRCSCS